MATAFWGYQQVDLLQLQTWMTLLINKNRGGRVTTGSDSGFIFQLYGFAYVRELELL